MQSENFSSPNSPSDEMFLQALIEHEAQSEVKSEVHCTPSSVESFAATPPAFLVPSTPFAVPTNAESKRRKLFAVEDDEDEFHDPVDALIQAAAAPLPAATEPAEEEFIPLDPLDNDTDADTAKPELSHDQRRVIDAVLSPDRPSVFFTGCAGTGKSVVLRCLKEQLPAETTYVTALTGIAALSIGGTTVHKFGGFFGEDSKSITEIVKMAAGNKKARSRWMNCRVLIIDEVSMMSSILFEALNSIAQNIRNNRSPFGGIQLVIDFYQLPPVSKGKIKKKFCFESNQWDLAVTRVFELRQVFRQADPVFQQLLAFVRVGRLTPEIITALRSRQCLSTRRDDGIEATALYPLNADVDRMNESRLQALQGEPVTYKAIDIYRNDFHSAKQKETDLFSAPAVLTLKIGAQVILLKNLSSRLVNGSRGVVIDFTTDLHQDGRYPVVLFTTGERRIIKRADGKFTIEVAGKEVARREQVPLTLAWAVSVHRCQGMTLDCAEVSLGKVFEPGMMYVALSRVRSLDGLYVDTFTATCQQPPPAVVRFHENVSRISAETDVPPAVAEETLATLATTTTTTTTATDETVENFEEDPEQLAALLAMDDSFDPDQL